MFPNSSQASAFCSSAAQFLLKQTESNTQIFPLQTEPLKLPFMRNFCDFSSKNGTMSGKSSPPKSIQTQNSTSSLFPPTPNAEDHLKMLQQFQFLNWAKFSLLQHHLKDPKLKNSSVEEEKVDDEIELRVGGRILILKRSLDENSLTKEYPTEEIGDILVYSVTTQPGHNYYAITFNGGDCLDVGQKLELNDEQFQLLPRTCSELEANVEFFEMDGQKVCQASKIIEPGDELVLYEGVEVNEEEEMEEIPSPLTPQKFDSTDNSDAFQFLFAANQLNVVAKKKATRVKKPIIEENNIPTGEEQASDSGYQCERCGKVFTYAYYRDKHLKYTRCVDNGDRKFPCTLCSRSFEKRDRLRIHILHVHENHRPHICQVCNKAFSQSSSLNKHLRVHSGERPYNCPFCPKSFTASSILRTHIRQHSGEKPFKCSFCGKAFASHAAHDSHVRRTHTQTDRNHQDMNDQKKIYGCTKCDKCFSAPNHLEFHQETVHLSKTH